VRRRSRSRSQIAENAGLEGGVVVEKVATSRGQHGLNAATGEYEDLIKAGVIDPAKVTRSALQNAASIAALFLTTEASSPTSPSEVHDDTGRVVLNLVRPAKFIKSTVVVSLPDGREVGQIRQENAIGKIRFAFEVNGAKVGGINAENWRAWDFAVVDAQGAEVARIKKTWEGLAKAMFTTADNYVVRFHRPVEEPLRTLVVASALTIDTALKQDDR
jgi:uncharacterized protein YxjI